MIDEKTIQTLSPEDRVIRLKEMADERKRDLQRIDQLMKGTIASLQKDAGQADRSRENFRTWESGLGSRPEQLDQRLARAPPTDQEFRPDVAAIAEMLGPMYAPPGFAKQENIAPSYQSFGGYESFKQTGYESLWTQRPDNTSREEEKKKQRDFLFP